MFQSLFGCSTMAASASLLSPPSSSSLNNYYRHFEAVEPRFLRASYSAFVDVATKTIEEFGQGMEL